MHQRGNSDKSAGVGIVEVARAGNQSINDVRELRGIHPIDLFFALTARGTALPAGLTQIYGAHKSPRSQGWALDGKFANFDPSFAGDSCNNADWFAFSEALLDYGYSHSQLTKDNGPSTQALLWDGMTGWSDEFQAAAR